MAVQKQEIVVNVTTNTKSAQANTKKLNKDLKKTGVAGTAAATSLSTSFGIFGGTVIPSLIGGLQVLKTQLISTGVGAVVVAIGALATLFIAAAKASIVFEKSTSNLKAVLAGTAESAQVLDDDMEALTKQAKTLGSTTSFTASQVLELQTNLSKLGFTTTEILNTTGATLDLAAALEIDLGTAAKFAGGTIRAFGLDTQDAQRIVDSMALSTNLSGLNFNTLSEALSKVGPVANAVGASIEETTAILAVLADNTIDGSLAGTALKNVFIELNKRNLTLMEGMDMVSNSADGLNTAMELTGKQGGPALLALAKAGPEALTNMTKALENAEGAAGRLAEMKLDNVGGDVLKLSSAWEGFLLQLEDGDGILNFIMRDVLQNMTRSISDITLALQIVSFAFNEWVKNMSGKGAAALAFGRGIFLGLEGIITKFAANSLIQMEKVPILGKSIDLEAVKENLKKAQDMLLDANKQFRIGVEIENQSMSRLFNVFENFKLEQAGKARKREAAAKAKADAALLGEIKIQTAEELAAEKKRLEAVQKKELIKTVNDFYDQEEVLADEKKAEKLSDKMAKFEEDEILKLEAKREKELQELIDLDAHEDQLAQIKLFYANKIEDVRQKKIDKEDKEEKDLVKTKKKLLNDTLNATINAAGRESKIGRALFIAKQAIALKELVMKAKNVIISAQLNAAEAGGEVAKGSAKAASSLAPPWNLVPIAMFAAQAISIVKSINQSKRKSQSAAGSFGGGSAGGDISVPTTAAISDTLPEPESPNFDIFGTSGTNQIASALGNQAPIQAFVVSQDVTSAQSLQNNIIQGSTLG